MALSYISFSFGVAHIISFDRYFENVSFGANVVNRFGSLNIDLPNAIYFWGRCTYELVPKYDPSQIGLKMFFGALRPHSFALSSFKGLTLKNAIRRVLLRLMHKKIFKAICYFCLLKIRVNGFHKSSIKLILVILEWGQKIWKKWKLCNKSKEWNAFLRPNSPTT